MFVEYVFNTTFHYLKIPFQYKTIKLEYLVVPLNVNNECTEYKLIIIYIFLSLKDPI